MHCASNFLVEFTVPVITSSKICFIQWITSSVKVRTTFVLFIAVSPGPTIRNLVGAQKISSWFPKLVNANESKIFLSNQMSPEGESCSSIKKALNGLIKSEHAKCLHAKFIMKKPLFKELFEHHCWETSVFGGRSYGIKSIKRLPYHYKSSRNIFNNNSRLFLKIIIVPGILKNTFLIHFSYV